MLYAELEKLFLEVNIDKWKTHGLFNGLLIYNDLQLCAHMQEYYFRRQSACV